MSKRNFTLLIIVLAVVVIGVFWFLHSNRGVNTGGGNGPGTNFISQFNPFASKPTSPATTPPANVSGYQPGGEQAAKLIKVSSMPIAGFGIFMKERLKETSTATDTATLPATDTGTTTTKSGKATKSVAPVTDLVPALRYVDRATGNIYETFADSIVEKRFSATIIPKVYDAYFGNNGDSVAMRYLKTDNETIETFVGALPKEVLGVDPAGDNEIKGSFLPDNTKDISVSADASKMFYLFDSGDSMIGTTLSLADGKKTQLFNSPFTEWLSGWPNDKTITLSTKPSVNIPGYMYELDTVKKSLVKALGDINGLTALESPDGKLILYGDSSLSLYIYHKDTGVSNLLGIRTMPEKCVWNNTSSALYCAVPKSAGSGAYPDSWYKGEISFSDGFWKVDVGSNNATSILDPATVVGGEEIDGIKLAVDGGENYLLFVNKKDSFLWEFNLK